jgi:hypothetical protein
MEIRKTLALKARFTSALNSMQEYRELPRKLSGDEGCRSTRTAFDNCHSSVIRLPAEALAKAGYSTFGFRHLIHPSGSCRIRG